MLPVLNSALSAITCDFYSYERLSSYGILDLLGRRGISVNALTLCTIFKNALLILTGGTKTQRGTQHSLLSSASWRCRDWSLSEP